MTESRNTKQVAGERELAALLYELTGHRPRCAAGLVTDPQAVCSHTAGADSRGMVA